VVKDTDILINELVIEDHYRIAQRFAREAIAEWDKEGQE